MSVLYVLTSHSSGYTHIGPHYDVPALLVLNQDINVGIKIIHLKISTHMTLERSYWTVFFILILFWSSWH